MKVETFIDLLDDMTDRTQGDVSDLLSEASRRFRELTKEPETRLVPIAVYEHVSGDKHCYDENNPGHNAKRIAVEAPPGTEVELTAVRCSGVLEKLLLVEVKQGDAFIWPQGIMDVGMLNDMPVEGIVLRDNEPLELYVNTVYSTPSEGGEPFSCCFMGKQTIVDAARYRESKREQAKASHFVHEGEFERWLPNTPQGDFLVSVVRQYIREEEPDLAQIVLDKVTVKQACDMPSTDWLKLFQQHIRKGSDSFVKQTLFMLRAESKRRGQVPYA